MIVPDIEMLTVSSVLQTVMEDRSLDQVALRVEIEAALDEYSRDATLRATIFHDIVANVDARYDRGKFKTIHERPSFGTIEEQTIVDAVAGVRKQHEETVYKLVVWLCWIEHHAADVVEPVRRDYRRDAVQLKRAADVAHNTKGAAFPHNLLTLNSLVQSLVAEAKNFREPMLHVVADCSDLGSFFRPELHRAMFNGMVELAERRSDVRLAVYGHVQAIASASRLSPMDPGLRMGDPGFQPYLKDFVTYLRSRDVLTDENDRRRRPVAFKDWLACHSGRDIDDLHNWIASYGPPNYRKIEKTQLAEWVRRAFSKVYGSADVFTVSMDDAHAVLALQWCREKYFEELLVFNNVGVKRCKFAAPSLTLWISQEQGAFGISQTRDVDIDCRGWIFAADVIHNNQSTEPTDPRRVLLKIFDSVFLGHWDQAEDLRTPSWFARVRAGSRYLDGELELTRDR